MTEPPSHWVTDVTVAKEAKLQFPKSLGVPAEACVSLPLGSGDSGAVDYDTLSL